MSQKQKIVRSTLKIVVLHEEGTNIESMNLVEVLRELYNDNLPGVYTLESSETLLGEEAILAACRAVGSDGSHFGFVPVNEAEVEVAVVELPETPKAETENENTEANEQPKAEKPETEKPKKGKKGSGKKVVVSAK